MPVDIDVIGRHGDFRFHVVHVGTGIGHHSITFPGPRPRSRFWSLVSPPSPLHPPLGPPTLSQPIMKRKVRLKDVAERAGVAVNTASTILNRRPNSWASKETEERVFNAAKELGYRPSKTARALQSGRYNSIGFLIQDLTNPFYATLADALETAV